MSELILDITRKDSGTVVRLHGDIDLHRSPGLHECLVDICGEGPVRLILDMSKVNYIDSSGVGSLVDIYRRLKRSKNAFVLVAPGPRVMSVLEITRLDKFFAIVNTQEEAMLM